ncbi:DUF362 domain-containing protein [Clostridiisalibacter paucivorans]|uniref:DUF362 domain-containing protein n=1 Tax=Clostridiisalibacter paucivorans TaxID=408753 RepID=UPI00047EF8DF|nr:DUF362 domain-containing protein [Clostridiisalibacter paucivorans]
MEKVGIINAHSYDNNLKKNLLSLLSHIGGLEKYISPGDSVLLKPNFITARSPEAAVNTHPKLIIALTEILIDYGCKVTIGDSPGLGSAITVAKKLGLIEKLQKYGVTFLDFGSPVLARNNNIDLSKKKFHQIYLSEEIYKYDKIINLPKLKSHAQMGITLATKNLFGCVVGRQKGQWHFIAGRDLQLFGRLIVEIAMSVNADLHILDGIWGMEGNGPTNGEKIESNVLLASDNPIALDRVVLEIIKKHPSQFPIFKASEELDLIGSDIKDIEILGSPISSCIIEDFKIPSFSSLEFVENTLLSGIIKKLINQKIKIDHSTCIQCQKCIDQCPANAMSMNDYIKIDHKKCIRCCCCQEICPVGAISVTEPLTLKLLKKIGF